MFFAEFVEKSLFPEEAMKAFELVIGDLREEVMFHVVLHLGAD